MLDDGRLTDGQGRTVDFRNVILILTSNLGSQFLADQTLEPELKRNAVMGVVRSAFKPEFLNRLDEVVLFEPLGTEELARIVEINLRRLNPGWPTGGSSIEVTPAAREWLALTGFDPVYGARPLRRLIQTTHRGPTGPPGAVRARSPRVTRSASTSTRPAMAWSWRSQGDDHGAITGRHSCPRAHSEPGGRAES